MITPETSPAPRTTAHRELDQLEFDLPGDWGLVPLSTMDHADFARIMLAASDGDPYDTSTAESAEADLAELVQAAGDAFDPSGWFAVSDERGGIGVVLPQPYPDDPTTGTIFYLAVLPHRRGEGLGRQLHRLGLDQLRRRGVQHYAGATDATNLAMASIFAANGCRLTGVSRWSPTTELDEAAVVDLYDAVGWSAYTSDPESLLAGIRGSLRVVMAHDRGRLVGLARVVGDGATICYLQDVLVHPEFRRRGLGRRLVTAAFAGFEQVRQHVLVTDEEPGQQAFYESLGFVQLGAGAPGRAFVRYRQQ